MWHIQCYQPCLFQMVPKIEISVVTSKNDKMAKVLTD